MNAPPLLLASCRDAANYPLNLVHKTVDTVRARQHQQRLDNTAYHLCMDEPEQIKNIQVSFRDWNRANPACNKINVFNDTDLARWLGDESEPPPSGQAVTKPDPHCRMVFLSAPNGRDSLQVTTKMLRRILTYHQVPAQYLDYLYLFGRRESSSDLKFGTFWSRNSLGHPRSDLICPDLGRSDEHYEMCFNLKGAEPKMPGSANPTDFDQWSIRHAAIYHKLDLRFGTTVWMMTKAKWNLKDTFRDATGDGSEPTARTFDDVPSCYRSSLAAHLLIARWALESWRPYLQCLEDNLEAKTRSAVITDYKAIDGKDQKLPIYTRSHLQEIIFYEEMATQAGLVLETNITVLKSLSEFYQGLVDTTGFPIQQDVSAATKAFAADLHYVEIEMLSLRSRATHLMSHAANRRQLVLNLMQAQNSDNMTDMTIRSVEEAIAMRIITIVTLLYLPATFVSTFFSTDVVKYQTGEAEQLPHTQYSSLAMNRWLQVTLPLTLITITIAICLYFWARRPLKKLEQSKV